MTLGREGGILFLKRLVHGHIFFFLSVISCPLLDDLDVMDLLLFAAALGWLICDVGVYVCGCVAICNAMYLSIPNLMSFLLLFYTGSKILSADQRDV